jgi:hypothetical protein
VIGGSYAHPRIFDRFPPGTQPALAVTCSLRTTVTVAAVARAVSVAADAGGAWALGGAALGPSFHVANLRDFGVTRDPSLDHLVSPQRQTSSPLESGPRGA